LSALVARQVRNQLTLPLTDLRESVRLAETDDRTLEPIPRGSPEIRELAAVLTRRDAGLRARLKDLTDARLHLESVLKGMEEGVLVFGDAGRITLSNDACRRLLGARSDLSGKTCLEVLRHEELDESVRAALRGGTVDAIEFRAASGRVLRALVSPVSSGSSRGREAAVMVLEDLTDIRRVDRIRRDFVANVSHEFKTPLTSIRGYAETMLAESQDESHREFAETICRNARYLESLVNDLLVLARIEAEPPSVLEDVDLPTLVGEQVALRRQPSRPASGIEVECGPIHLRADPGRLSIALSNLIDNAIRYNRPAGTVRIACRSEGDAVLVEVRDQGYGIPEDELPRIFERFYRVDRARTRNAGGTGLGLAIARHAVESQGGSLTVVSQAGAGSTFRIRLPLRDRGVQS
jgi:two-component system phosphate regulon sensor histidine kinase PhoR